MRFKLIVIATLYVFVACQNTDKKSVNDTIEDTIVIESTDVVQVKEVFYNIPSPVEMVQIIEGAGVNYNKDLLNPYSNVDNYITTEDLAMNLGIYGADLSYNRIFDQMQESLNYLVAIQKISEQLKIPQEEGSFAISRFEENIDNRDSLLIVITETYAHADMYLKENHRASTAALVVLGGWIEALYIATHLVNEENEDRAILERIAEQKYSYENILKLMQKHVDEILILNTLGEEFAALEEAFNKIDIEQKTGEVETDQESKSTKIGGTTINNVEYENIVEIKNIIFKIRNHIIGKS